MIDEDKIQEVHDILHAVICGEVELPMSQSTKISLHATHDVLCWILGHESGDTFVENMNILKDKLKRSGYVMERIQ